MLAAVLVLAAAPAGAGGKHVPYGKGLLWRIEAQRVGVAPNYLFGTMHVTDDRVVHIPKPVRKAFYASDRLVFEVVIIAPQQLAAERTALVEDGRTLDYILSRKKWNYVSWLGWRKYGIPQGQLRQLKPWAVSMILGGSHKEAARLAQGHMVLDAWLQAEGHRLGKPLWELESAAEQFAVFDGLPIKVQLALLDGAIARHEHVEKDRERMIRVYLKRDTGRMYRDVERIARKNPGLRNFYFERLMNVRNRAMARRARSLLAKGGTFIAVGALHLPGEQGMLNLFARDGYRVRRIY